MIKVFIDAIGIAAPGLPNWQTAAEVFKGNVAYTPIPLEKYKPELLPPNERRRATELVRLAFRVCEDAANGYAGNLRDCASVFASSGGDYPIIDQICRSLTEPEKLVSPTQFHNSVHNSAAGYWSIAVGSTHPSNSLSAYDDSFRQALQEALLFVAASNTPCLFTCYDLVPPSPLTAKRPIAFECGIALVLSPTQSTQSVGELIWHLDNTQASGITPCQTDALEHLRLGNPAARGFPLLEALARQEHTPILLGDNLSQAAPMRLEINPCLA